MYNTSGSAMTSMIQVRCSDDCNYNHIMFWTVSDTWTTHVLECLTPLNLVNFDPIQEAEPKVGGGHLFTMQQYMDSFVLIQLLKP